MTFRCRYPENGEVADNEVSKLKEQVKELESQLAAQVRTTDDFGEGARAFAEKRPPAYKAK